MSMPISISMRICGALPIIAAALLLILSCSGCASITEGTTQTITIASNPPSSMCIGIREGATIFQARGGERVMVSKSRNPIKISCTASGFEPATILVDSNVSTMGAIGIGIDFGLTDYATGALNKYPDTVSLTLLPSIR